MSSEAVAAPVCLGHSHAAVLAEAAAAAGAAIDVLNFWHWPGAIADDGEDVRFSPALLARLRAPLFSLIGGAVHLDVGLMRHPQPFDFVWPERPDLPLDAAAAWLPFDAVRDAMTARIAPYLRQMRAARQAIGGRMFHLEAPPVAFEERRPADPGFDLYFGAAAEFASPWLRWRLWRLQSVITAEACAACGVAFVQHPAEAVTQAGFLRPDLQGTPGHANAAYGHLLLRQIEALAMEAAGP